MRSSLSFGLFILLALSGCGQKSENNNIDTIALGPNENFSSYMHGLDIDYQTPEGVGTLLTLHQGMYGESNVSLCTWFLVDKNKAITNSHCIPDELKEDNGLSCGDYLQGGFKTQSGLSKVRCKNIIHVSDISSSVILNNDYALLELEKDITNSAVFKLDRSGFRENQKVKILTMNHQQPSGIYSEFKEHDCLMKSSDLLGKISSPGSSPLTGFQEEGTSNPCKTIEGNSGSPVINESGNLIGVLHGGMKQGFDLNQAANISSSELTSNISILTNLRCQKFDDPILDADYPSECATETETSAVDKEKLLNELRPKIEKLLEVALAKQPNYFEYEIDLNNVGSNSFVNFNPKCIKPLDQWEEKDLSSIYKEGLFFTKKGIKTIIDQHILEFIISLDYYGNFKMDAKFGRSWTIQLIVSGLHDLEDKKEVNTILDLSSVGLDSSIEKKIPRCQDQDSVTSDTQNSPK